MIRRSAVLAVALAGALAASCAEKPKAVATAPAPKPVPTTTAAAAQGCVNLRQIRESIVRSDKVIDFVLLDGSTLRNRLPYACSQLGFERAFTYATSLDKLCSVDIITVIIQGGGPSRGASCGLGQFTPISPEMAKAPLTDVDR